MTEQKLREKIANIIRPLLHSDWYPQDAYDDVTSSVADQILALIKEAGYVQLAEVQTLPTNDWGDTELNRGWHIAQKEMLKADWRKVELEE